MKLAYIQQVRSVLEIAVPVWNSGLSISEKIDIERVQKTFCHIVLGQQYNSYIEALASLGLESLEEKKEKCFVNLLLWNQHRIKSLIIGLI